MQTYPKLTQLQQNPQAVLRNQLNNSSSKRQFAFSQSQRFDQSHTSASPNKFYELPSLWSSKNSTIKRGASIGRSHRVDFSKQNVSTPSPNKYDIQSYFNKNKKKKDGYTMGLGRQQVKCRNMFVQAQKKCPDSGTYHPEYPTPTKSYSMSQRLDNLDNKWIKMVPGPGNYPVYELTNKNNYKCVSKYMSTPTSIIGKQKRASLASNSVAPGPGQYQQRSQSFDQSQFQKPRACRFGTGERSKPTLASISTPGPGTYKYFSQFLR